MADDKKCEHREEAEKTYAQVRDGDLHVADQAVLLGRTVKRIADTTCACAITDAERGRLAQYDDWCKRASIIKTAPGTLAGDGWALIKEIGDALGPTNEPAPLPVGFPDEFAARVGRIVNAGTKETKTEPASRMVPLYAWLDVEIARADKYAVEAVDEDGDFVTSARWEERAEILREVRKHFGQQEDKGQ